MCELNLFIHSPTSMVQPLKFYNGLGISLQILLGMWLLIPDSHFILCCMQFYSETTAHYGDITMSPIASQITNFTVVYSIVCSGADQK